METKKETATINNNTFIDIIPIIENNRKIVKKLILSNTKDKKANNIILPKEQEIKFKYDSDGMIITFYKVGISTETNRLLYYYRYGKNNSYYDWDVENEIDIEIENKILNVIYNIMRSK